MQHLDASPLVMLVRMTTPEPGRGRWLGFGVSHRIRGVARQVALGWLNLVRGSDVAIIYASIITVAAVVVSLVPDRIHDSLVLRSSTNLVWLGQRARGSPGVVRNDPSTLGIGSPWGSRSTSGG